MEEKLKKWVNEFLEQIKTSEKPSIWLEQQRENGNLKEFFPELLLCYQVEQNQYHKYDVYYHLLYSCDSAAKREAVKLAALFHDIGKARTKKNVNGEWVFYNHEIISTEIAFQVFKRWGLPRFLVKKTTLLIRNHMFHYQENWTDSAVRRVMRKVGRENMEDLFLLRVADREGNGFRRGEPLKVKDFKARIEKILVEEKRFKILDLEIKGNDIIEMGLKEGPVVGKVLKQLFQMVKDNKLDNQIDELKREAEKIIQSDHFVCS